MGLLHLAAGLDGDPGPDAVLLAERGGLDFVTLAGDDPLSLLALTSRIGLVSDAVPGPAHGRAGVRVEGPGLSGRTADAAVRVAEVTFDQADLRLAVRYADVVLVRAAGRAQAGAVREELRREVAAAGRDPDAVRVLASLRIDLGGGEHAAEPGHGGGGPRHTAHGPLYRGGPVDLAELIARWHAEGVTDGFHVTPVEPRSDLERFVNGTVALLQHRGLFRTFYPGGTLREHLGLPYPAPSVSHSMERLIT
ncbi:alkanesulfonate monooxygenase SsuD/methylene tetrahydromethanopterin reductase-like flavin-dependent oxidoreductase (luciferase family) [Streptomyces sp. SAI-170]|uniref:LLM class flavin-dependent oxidoreductase n=1 Tax=Streptomyces sp. SAI-170 TaxID=3377729 RepID=UPI003C7A4357